jgi:hypothetical protein
MVSARRCCSSRLGCPDAIRTLSSLQHDDVESKFEDADTDGEDHAPDEGRYGCMSRPRKLPEPRRTDSQDYRRKGAWNG